MLLLAGCATTAAPDRPEPALPDGFSVPWVAPQQAPSVVMLLANDPALEPLLTAARAASPDLETAAARIQQARGALALARIASAPVSKASTAIERFGFDAPGAGMAGTVSAVRPVIEARWELDVFGRLKPGRQAAKARLDAATADAAATRLSLESDIARNLVAVRALDARGAAADEAAAAARVLERLALVRAEAGLATGLDVATAKADVAAADAGIEPIIAERAARVAALMRLTGLPTDRIAGLLIPVQPLLSADGWAISQVPANLLQRRPDVAASAARLAAADRDVATAVMARYPNVTLTGTLTWMTSTLSGLFLLEGITGGGGAVLAGPLLDFGRVAAEVERSRGVAAELAGLYRGTVLGALAEVEAALAEAKAARRQAAALGQSAAALDRARALAETAYRGGLTDARAAAEAARRLADARDRQLAAEALALDAALRLELAAGGGLGVPGLADAAGTAGQAGGIAKLTSRNN